MAKEPWFKFWSAEYLCDPDVDDIPREAEGLLVRMWCVCNLRGSIPSDPAEIARLTRCDSHYVSQCVSHCVSFFENRGGNLFSLRMEREKSKSEAARQSAQARYKSDGYAERTANRTANRTAFRTAKKAREIDIKTERESGGEFLPETEQQLLTLANSHPKAAGRFLSFEQVPNDLKAAMIDAITLQAAGPPAVSEQAAYSHILKRTLVYAQQVTEWPPGERRFAANLVEWFTRAKFNEDPQLWGRSDERQTGETRRLSSAEERSRKNLDATRTAIQMRRARKAAEAAERTAGSG